jgi:hypothetical protein
MVILVEMELLEVVIGAMVVGLAVLGLLDLEELQALDKHFLILRIL